MRQCHPSPLPQLAANTRHAAPPALPAVCAQLSGRRLQNHGGIVHAKGLIPAPIPRWLQQLLKALPAQLLGLFPADQPPNHVLINSYQPGCGIMVRTSCLWLSCSFLSCVFGLICTMTHSVRPAAKHLPMAQVCCLCLPATAKRGGSFVCSSEVAVADNPLVPGCCAEPDRRIPAVTAPLPDPAFPPCVLCCAMTMTVLQPHEDGPLYHPVVLILSLGSPAVLRFWRKQETGQSVALLTCIHTMMT